MASKARCVTCDDCFFRKSHLCALALPEPCPTFRPATRREMIAPRQARLVPAAGERLVPAAGVA
ncbi:MAG TPA: hypothetical protein VMU66_08640 [Gaiellales bacterium]|nr:hypothetical protein [Gaiellales bacterium]